MISFDMVAKLAIGKETEKFKPYETTEYKSGWTNRTLRFNAISGDNRFMLTAKGGCYSDGSGDLYLFSKDSVDESGNKVKGKMFTIPFKDRFNEDKIAETAEWKKFTCDLEIPGRRWKLEHAVEKLNDGHEFTDEELTELGVDIAKDIPAELEKSKKKRKEFLSAYDYAEFLYKMLTSDKYKDKKFHVRGTYEMQYSDEKQRWYNSYVPTRIYLAKEDEEEAATENVVLFYDENSLDEGSVEEKKKYYVNGYVETYDNNRKKNIFAPYTVVINADDNEKKIKKLVDMFTVDDGVKQLGLVIDMIDGSQKKKIEMSDLDEETQDNILCGLIEFDDVVKELGGNVYGERVTENRFKKLGKGYASGAHDTVYTSEDFAISPLGYDNEDLDLFADDDDLFN